ncbi:hypothetical protein LR68_03223 [Anoxybacillus sp. BCO1]|nr:hypothetical protein LR68_03223 [Anoxybacillus sp. BCO1]
MEPFSTIPKEVKSDVNDRWVASRFNILSHEENGDLYICNTYTGHFYVFHKLMLIRLKIFSDRDVMSLMILQRFLLIMAF